MYLHITSIQTPVFCLILYKYTGINHDPKSFIKGYHKVCPPDPLFLIHIESISDKAASTPPLPLNK